MVHHTF